MTGTNSTGKTLVTMTCSAGSAGTSSSTDTHSNCTFAGTAISTTPEPKSSGSLPSGSRSEIHYPTVLHNSSAIYITKKKRKLVRFFTVVAYMFAVSLVAIVLSLYYVFLWNPYLVSLPGGGANGNNNYHYNNNNGPISDKTFDPSTLSAPTTSYQHNININSDQNHNRINNYPSTYKNIDSPSIITKSLLSTLPSHIDAPLKPSPPTLPQPLPPLHHHHHHLLQSQPSASSPSLTSSSSLLATFSSSSLLSSSSSPSSSSTSSSSSPSPSSSSSLSTTFDSNTLDFVSPSAYLSSSSPPTYIPPMEFSPSSYAPLEFSSSSSSSSSSPSLSSDLVSAFSSYSPSSSSDSSSVSTIDWIMDVTNTPNVSLN